MCSESKYEKMWWRILDALTDLLHPSLLCRLQHTIGISIFVPYHGFSIDFFNLLCVMLPLARRRFESNLEKIINTQWRSNKIQFDAPYKDRRPTESREKFVCFFCSFGKFICTTIAIQLISYTEKILQARGKSEIETRRMEVCEN